ncbi:MAG: class A beta-lactamase-related serine hydrolase [Acidobacteria bacterium]|nr:MAG: class A beta-lactamase-related serine hydrolase [Acidobacteriota bacterium]REK00396.1 MAG: class A beta-lactamase-related serine hydrolase [Acidobacteriota bacterium]
MSDATIRGTCDDRFSRVAEAFAQNFEDDLEIGASFAVTLDGEIVVDVWGGFADRDETRVWGEDTLVNVWSTTKGLTALCLAMLVDRGELVYDRRVHHYWPEFKQGGKESITVETLLSHQAGLCGLREPTDTADYYDQELMAARLAAMEPLWEPGTANGYHAITFGFLAAELVRRITGASLGEFFDHEVADEVGADVYIGLDEDDDERVAELIAPPERKPPAEVAPEHVEIVRAATGNPALDPEIPNDPAWRRAQIPAANAHAGARGLAQIYGVLACGGDSHGRFLLEKKTLDEATRERCKRRDLVLAMPIRWSAGWALNIAPTYGPNREAFGHSGWGGSTAFADPSTKLAIGYTMNQMQANLQGDPRTLRLIEATYASHADLV